MEAFELRLWDGRLGRWLTVDPMGQYFSPYLGMGNNPISRIDPDGGMDGDPQIPPLLSGQSVQLVHNSTPNEFGPANFSMDFTVEGVIVNQVVPRIIQHYDKGLAFTAGFLNAFGSNFFLGGGRQSSQNWSNEETRIYHKVGQLGGDIASIVWGAIEFGGSDAIAGIGILGAPESGGASLVLVPAAAGVKAHGAVMSGVALQNTLSDIKGLYDSFSKGKHSGGGSSGDGIGKNSKKMSLDQLDSFFGEGWHQKGSKTKFLKRFSKALKGDTNADFYVDSETNEVLLKSNKSGHWVQTGEFLE